MNCKLTQDRKILKCQDGRIVAGLLRSSMYVCMCCSIPSRSFLYVLGISCCCCMMPLTVLYLSHRSHTLPMSRGLMRIVIWERDQLNADRDPEQTKL